MKLLIQIPCLNEEKSLPNTIRDIPKNIPGVDRIETLIIDDGSTDRTIDVAQKLGVNHIIKLTNNKGLAESFMAGDPLDGGGFVVLNGISFNEDNDIVEMDLRRGNRPQEPAGRGVHTR